MEEYCLSDGKCFPSLKHKCHLHHFDLAKTCSGASMHWLCTSQAGILAAGILIALRIQIHWYGIAMAAVSRCRACSVMSSVEKLPAVFYHYALVAGVYALAGEIVHSIIIGRQLAADMTNLCRIDVQ